jgi:hypothetical protein
LESPREVTGSGCGLAAPYRSAAMRSAVFAFALRVAISAVSAAICSLAFASSSAAVAVELSDCFAVMRSLRS